MKVSVFDVYRLKCEYILEAELALANFFPLKLNYKDVDINLTEDQFNVQGLYDQLQQVGKKEMESICFQRKLLTTCLNNTICVTEKDGRQVKLLKTKTSVSLLLLYVTLDEDEQLELFDCS